MKLENAKHQIFVEAYLANGGNAGAAYSVAYPKAALNTCASGGAKLLQNPDVKDEIARQTTRTLRKFQITKEKLIDDLLTIKDLCLTNPRHTQNSIRAIEVIAKMLGLNEPDKLNLNHSGNIDISKLVEFDDEDSEDNEQD